MDPLTATGAIAAVGTASSLISGALTDADSIGASIVSAASRAPVAIGAAMSPRLPTTEQIAAWERKVGRPASKRAGIRLRPRVRTYPYLRSQPLKLQPFAAMAARVMSLSPAGGTILALIGNIEGAYESNSTWNRNSGNVKLYSSLALADETPECWFIVDSVRSLDLYQSFGVGPNDSADQYLEDNPAAWEESIRDGWRRTFGQPHYQNSFAIVSGQRKSFMDCMNAGLVQQVCCIMGGNGYARSYRSGSFMTARFNRLVRANRLDNNLRIVPARIVAGRDSRSHNFTEVA